MRKQKDAKKPISKKTKRLNEQLQRRQGVRELEKRFLIVCEDGKSSPNYFKALRKHFSLSAASIEVAGSNGRSQPIQVVSRALELKKEAAKPTSGTVPFDQVWCVIDGDYGIKTRNARARAKANQIHLAVTTKCFEYWVLLHFEANDKSTSDCNGIVRSLKSKHLPDYEKGTCDFKDIVHRVNEACQRAEKVRKPGIDRGDLPENQNPCSEIYQLVNEILGTAKR